MTTLSLKDVTVEKVIEAVKISKSISDTLRNLGSDKPHRNQRLRDKVEKIIAENNISIEHFSSKRRSEVVELKEINGYSIEEFKEIVSNSINISDILRNLNCEKPRTNIRLRNKVKRMIEENNISTEHFIGEKKPAYHWPDLEEYLKLDGKRINSYKLKAKLYEAGLLKEICSECGLGPEYNGKPLTLQLDHIDGNKYNNELSNLRILCPSCHSQTDTYNGRNKIRYEK